MRSLKLLYLLAFLSLPFRLVSQENPQANPVLIENLIENIAGETEEELDYQTLFYDISAYLEEPLDINTASREDLEKLHVLTDFQVTSLLEYIRSNGPLLTIYELPLVYGYDEALARMLEPLLAFETTAQSRDLAGIKPEPSHQLMLRFSSVLEQQKGYSPATDSILLANPNARYMGNRLKTLTKYRFRYGKRIEAGFTGEKDAGEPFLNGDNKYGFDFNSAYLRVNDVWKFNTLIAGDYQVRSGQGVVLGSGLSFGKSPEIINIRKKGSTLKPYTSSDENRFMRGVALSMDHKWLSLTGFASYKKIDANAYVDTLDQEEYFSSFQNSGLHSIPREFDDKDAVQETILGASASVHAGNLKVGATVLQYYYDAAYLKREPVNMFNFSGSSNMNAGLDYTWSKNRFLLFGEGGYSSNGTFACLNGASFDLHSQVTLSVLHRYFDKAFHALYGNAFTENPYNRNENGIYTGIEILPFPDWKLSGFLDAYSFPYLKSLVTDPGTSGFDYHIQAEFNRRDGISAYIRYKYKAKSENVSGDLPGIQILDRAKVSHLRFHISYPVAPGLTFQDRVELSSYEKSGIRETGFLAYHDVLYRPPSLPLSLSFRYSMFDTESYKSRIYSYEHDVLYAFSIPNYYGRGIRTYLNASWEISHNIDLWLKYAMSWYPERETISSGLNEIPGHKKSDLRMQVRLRF